MRERWGSGRGFLLATLGSAVGLGKVWRFSYVAGENGGGAFLLVYLVMVFLVGVPLLLGEFALGCNTQRESAAAFKAMAPTSPWRHLGLLGVIVASLILGYCALIAGWVLKYLLLHLLGATQEFAAAGFSAAFRGSIAHPLEPIAWQFSVMVLTVAAVGDTLFAVMAGLVIFPAVFSFGRATRGVFPDEGRGAGWCRLLRTAEHRRPDLGGIAARSAGGGRGTLGDPHGPTPLPAPNPGASLE